jgi:hypothetical protein
VVELFGEALIWGLRIVEVVIRHIRENVRELWWLLHCEETIGSGVLGVCTVFDFVAR